MTNFNDLDRIEFSMQELLKLFEWKEENKELVNNYKPLLNEGLVVVKDGLTIYFKFLEDNITVYEGFDGTSCVCRLKTERHGSMNRIIESWVDAELIQGFRLVDPTFNDMDLITDTVTTVASSMAYIQNFKSQVIERIEPFKMSNTQRKRAEWHNRNSKNSKVIKLNKVVYTIPSEARYTNPDRQPMQRHTDSWGVRGHIRRLKGNREIWVKPYQKGKGAKQPKTYKIEDTL